MITGIAPSALGLAKATEIDTKLHGIKKGANTLLLFSWIEEFVYLN